MAVMVGGANSAVLAQSAGLLTPRISVTETVTSDIHAVPGVKDGALITQLSPGISYTANSRSLRAYVDYALNATSYLKSDRKSDLQNALTGVLNAELLDNLLFLDVDSRIFQQTVSAFGLQAVAGSQSPNNRAEVWSLGVSPRLTGNLGTLANYTARVNWNVSNTRDSIVGDSTSKGAQLSLSNYNRSAQISWGLNASVQEVDFRDGRDTDSKRAGATLGYNPNPDLRLFLTGGMESNNFGNNSSTGSYKNYGAGVNWIPSERTNASVSAEHRFFGNSHTINLEHRLARTVWRYADSKDVVTGAAGLQTSTLGSNYDLYFKLLASQEPDPVKRDLLVRATLRNAGLDPAGVVVAGFLSSSATITRRQEFSIALQGVRNTVTIAATRSNSHRIEDLVRAKDDLAVSSQVVQTGFSANFSHKLTPISSVNFSLSQQNINGDKAAQSSKLRAFNANWTSNLGNKTNLLVGARLAKFSATLNPYNEKALFATLSRQF